MNFGPNFCLGSVLVCHMWSCFAYILVSRLVAVMFCSGFQFPLASSLKSSC